MLTPLLGPPGPMPDRTPHRLPSVPVPLAGAWSSQGPRKPGPAPLGPPPRTPPSLREGAPLSPPLLGPGTDFPALGPRLWGPPWAEGGSAGGPAPAPGSLGGGLGALLRETRFARVATHLRLLHPNPPRRLCPCLLSLLHPLSCWEVCLPLSVQGGGSEGCQGNPGACEGHSPHQSCLQNPSDGPSGHPSAPRPSV